MEETSVKRVRPRQWLLHRGESAVASVGLILAAILLGAMAAVGSWTLITQSESIRVARTAQVETVGVLLAQSAETMLEHNELSTLRRLVMETSFDHDLEQCRIILASGENVADMNPDHMTIHRLPDTWLSGGMTDLLTMTSDGTVTVYYPLEVAGRGSARLEVVAPINIGPWAYWEAQTGVGATGAAALIALLLVYRRMRSKLNAIGAVREALLAMAEGETSPGALAVNPALGPEAEAWNKQLTEKERLRMELLASRAQEPRDRRQSVGDLESACDAMSQGLVLVDGSLRTRYANGAAAVLLETDRDNLLNMPIDRVITDERIMEAIRSVVHGGLRRRSMVELKREADDGYSVLRITVRPVRRGDAASAMVMIEDITQQRLADEARNSFVAQATHELRTPLTNIRLYVESAIDEGEKDPTVRAQCLNVINQESRRLERIVGDMLSVSEIDAGTLKLRHGDVRLEAMFCELEADYQAQAKEKNIALRFNLPPKLPVIQGDRDKIALALHNLIANALKYTPPGGRVTVSVQAETNRLSVDVADTGIGIRPEETERVFEKFYRAKDERVGEIKGTGLGLTLAREVIRLHGGDITIDSELDHGSTFTLTLPIMAQAA